MLEGQPTLDSGTKRLLELGIRQQLHRPLHWSQSAMICFCILSSITCITGMREWPCISYPKDPVDHHLRICRLIRPGSCLWRSCCAGMGVGLCRDLAYLGRCCHERAMLRLSGFWRTMLLVIHASWQAWSICQLDRGMDQPAWSGDSLQPQSCIWATQSRTLVLCKQRMSHLVAQRKYRVHTSQYTHIVFTP